MDFSQNVCAASCLKVAASDLQLNVLLCDACLKLLLSLVLTTPKTVSVASCDLNVGLDSACTLCHRLCTRIRSWRRLHAKVTGEENRVLQGSVKEQ